MMWKSLFGLVALAAMAQTPAAEAPAGRISGIVRDATTRAPLPDVSVRVGGLDAKTDFAGRFAFEKVDAGQQWVSAFDVRRAAWGGANVLVKPGDEPAGVEILLKLGGSISGRVLDPDRKPVAGVSVLLLQRKYEFGETAYHVLTTVTADKDGGYRIAPVRAEKPCVILAKKKLAATDISAEAKRPPVLTPTYFPASDDLQNAEAIALALSEDRGGVDIRMVAAPGYCIGGSVHPSGDQKAAHVFIEEQLPFVSGWNLTPLTTKVTPEGAFRACGLHPGQYEVSVLTIDAARRDVVSASGQATVTDRDLDDVKLTPRPFRVPVTGDATWDPPPPGKAAEAPVLLGLMRHAFPGKYADDDRPLSMVSGGVMAGARIRVSGPFTMAAIAPGDYLLHVSRMPEGCYLKTATYAGASVLHRPLRLAGESGRLQLVLACDSGTLTARVTDHDGNPVSNVSLFVIPASVASAAELSDLLRRETVSRGWSAVKTLPPGKYLVLAGGLELDETVEPIEKLWAARSQGEEIEISPGGITQVSLEVTRF